MWVLAAYRTQDPQKPFELRHHLVDPRTGEPSGSDLDHVTVVAGSAWVAEVLGKAVLLRGSTYCFDILGGTGAEALAVTTVGEARSTPGLAAYLGERSVLAG